jgi:hypothetical protein
MLSYYRYWQTLNRLQSSSKTIQMMEPDVPDMVQAQHEMIEREMEYWKEESQKFTIILLILFLFCGIMLILFTQGLLYV